MPGKFEAPRGGNRRNPGGRENPSPQRNRTSASGHNPHTNSQRQGQPPRRRRKKSNLPLAAACIILAILVVAAGALLWWKLAQRGSGNTIGPNEQVQNGTESQPTQTQQPEGPHVVSTATIGAMGDLLMHKPIFDDLDEYDAVVQQADGSYDFTSVFQYLSQYSSGMDYAVANLETTLAGTDNGYPFSGYPRFNCPDSVVDSVKAAGFDMLLTSNNHSYDTTLVGYQRTLEVIRGQGLETLGTMLSPEEPKYTIQEINGIKIGMIAYTYATYDTEDGRPSLNDNAPIQEAGICNYFTYDNLTAFYDELEGHLEAMEQEGAEATILFIHWGTEYELTQNEQQSQMAQSLCDLGIDVIIGGHPHVVQPMELLTSSTDPDHKTVCLYSLGNAVSNQRLGSISYVKTAHTEDGILFSVTFEKWSDGSVYLAGTDALPTWVNKYRNSDGKDVYNILPLDVSAQDQWQELYGLTDTMYTSARDSYQRTMDIVGEGLEECRNYLTQAKEAREAEKS